MKVSACVCALCLFISSGLLADTLRVVSEAWPPYVFERDGRAVGVDLEVAEQVLRELGHDVSWDLMPWKRAMRTVEIGDAHAILDISPNAERLKLYRFPDEHLSTSETVLFYNRHRPRPFTSLADLSGLTIGVSPGYAYSNPAFVEATHFVKEPAPNLEANLRKLTRGRLDMVAMDRRVGLFLAQQMGITKQLAYHARTLSSGDMYLAFHNSDALADLADSFGPALRAFKQTPEYDAILKRYGDAVGRPDTTAALP